MPELLTTHRTMLERWRWSMNLVGPGPVQPHYDDCAAALEGLEPAGRWADLGTGAGFPGVVFAATYPEVEVDLVDSRHKRCVFLEAVLAEAEVGSRVRVVRARIETLPDGGYDGIMARALAPWPAVVEHARRLLVPGGHALLLTGEADQPRAQGFEVAWERTYPGPGRTHRTTLLRLVRTQS